MLDIKQFTVNPFQENTYVVWDSESKEAAIIDCGALFAGEEEKIASFIKENGLIIRHVLNTHLHLDHAFGNAWAAEVYGLKCEAAEADEFLAGQMKQHAAAFGLPTDIVKGFRIGGYLTDGDVVMAGNLQLRVITTPGHTPGGICFYCEAEAIVFTGDTLFEESIGRTDLPGGSHSDLLRSIAEKLMRLPDETKVMCGHGPATTIGHERKYNPFFNR